jgi:hypothetical protein
MDTAMEELRRLEFSRLDASGHDYLDYTGAGLYPESLIRTHSDVLFFSQCLIVAEIRYGAFSLSVTGVLNGQTVLMWFRVSCAPIST